MSEQEMQDVGPAEAEGVEQENGAEVESEAEREEREKRVPVSESIRYRRRAQAAEQKLQEMQTQLETAERSLNETRQALRDVERRQQIDQLLSESEAVDLEAARLLTEAAVAQMDEPDVQAAVVELRSRKPYLFRRSASAGGGSMAARRRHGSGGELADAADAAATTGQRQDLLRYLRMRRGRNG